MISDSCVCPSNHEGLEGGFCIKQLKYCARQAKHQLAGCSVSDIAMKYTACLFSLRKIKL